MNSNFEKGVRLIFRIHKSCNLNKTSSAFFKTQNNLFISYDIGAYETVAEPLNERLSGYIVRVELNNKPAFSSSNKPASVTINDIKTKFKEIIDAELNEFLKKELE